MPRGTERVALVMAGLAACASAATYDFLARNRYPGPVRVEGVDLYKAEQEGGPFAEGYKRRVVHWWPRRGVDIIEVEEGMPLRTWTFRQRKEVVVDKEWLTRQLPSDHPLQLKAHLIGFRGIGNRYAPSGREEDYVPPAVVLRLPDGRKRCFVRGTFVEKDEKYALDLFLKELERIRKGLKKVKYEINPALREQWPNNAKPGEPGTMQVVGEHVMFVSGSQPPEGEPDNPWVGTAHPERSRRFREGSVVGAEIWWAFNEYIGNLMPFWDRKKKFKYTVTVCGTVRDGYKYIPGYAGGGYSACGLKNALGGPWSLGLFHEWVHGHAAGRWHIGGHEIQADTGQVIADPAVLNFGNNVSRPWRCCLHGAYKTCLFYAIMGDDPNWGYGMALTLPSGVGEKTLFQTLARLGEQRGLWRNGIRGVGDMVGEFTARLAEFDCELQYVLRQTPSPYPWEMLAPRWNWLEPMDPDRGLYRIFREEAPEPFGSNVIPLAAEKGAKEIRVDFRGLYEPETYGDWRACIVAVEADGRPRYSPLWNKGEMAMEVRPGDRRFWLTVAATPWAFCVPEKRSGRFNEMYFGRYAPRYPYEVRLTGCRPAMPHFRPGMVDDHDLVYAGGFHLCKVPYPGDSPEAAWVRKALPKLEARLAAFEKALEKAIAEGKRKANEWHTRNMRRFLNDLTRYAHSLRDALTGARHPNGGGWVAASARVARTAYVGPNAMVLDGAQVLDDAIVENFAVVTGPKVVVKNHARVSGRAYVTGNVLLKGYARTWHEVRGPEETTLVLPEVPLRDRQKEPDPQGLWANYALDRPEAFLLEDWFRFKPGYMTFHELNLDGTLYGHPRFVVEDGHRGFYFDGKTQYAEAAPTLADLGQITVDISLKWAGGENQVVFDFGSSLQNRFVLFAAGPSGRSELLVVHDARTQRLVADRPLPKDQWSRCRVEIDGGRLALWIDGRLAGRRASNFRPCDAFAPDAPKRNLLAMARDGSAHFRGILDFVHVYHKVHDDFANVPEAPRHAPRRVSREFIEWVKKQAGDVKKLNEEVNKRFKRDYKYYEEMRKQIEARLAEIRDSSPQAKRAKALVAKAKEELSRRQRELPAEFNRLHPELAAREKQLSATRKDLEKQKRQLKDKPTELATVQKQLEQVNAELRKISTQRRLFVVRQTAPLKRKVAMAEKNYAEASAEAALAFAPEYRWLSSLSKAAYSGYYNTPYSRYLGGYIRRQVFGGTHAVVENPGELEAVLASQAPESWHKRCDWEWRTRWELDGSIAELPLLREWLERARGNVQVVKKK